MVRRQRNARGQYGPLSRTEKRRRRRIRAGELRAKRPRLLAFASHGRGLGQLLPIERRRKAPAIPAFAFLPFHFLRAFVRRQTHLAWENVALRHQIDLLERRAGFRGRRTPLRRWDRLFWIVLSWLWSHWRKALFIARPETVLGWHRELARLLWGWKSRGRLGRPPIPAHLIHLIRRLSKENPLWGAPRIQSELWLLGHKVSEWAVNKYMVRPSKGLRSQSWRAFLENNRKAIATCDFFTVTTAAFQKLQAFVVMSLDRRRILHVAATRWTAGGWVAKEIAKADLPSHGIRFLIRDNDTRFQNALATELEIERVANIRTRYRSPWQNGLCERVIESIRRECTDHLFIVNARHLSQVLREFAAYYNETRTHLSLDRNAPIPRSREPGHGRLVATRVLGGLHHRYRNAA